MTENTRLLKPEELREIAERERKATPGPWEREQDGYVIGSPGVDYHIVDVAGSEEDAEFIAASRTDISRLLAHIEAQQAEIERLKNTIAFVKYEIGNEMDFAWQRDNTERYEAFEYVQRQFEVIEEAL